MTTSKKKPARSAHALTSAPHRIVGIGASAGGLEAVTELLEHLPKKTGLAFVYVQHLDPLHESLLASLLSHVAPIPVEEAQHGTHLLPDHFYIVPPGKDALIARGVLKLVTRIGNKGRLVSIDTFFHSLAKDQKSKSIGIILSGNASDGVIGLESIKSEGGITFAQSESSAKHPSMPHTAIISSAADYILTPTNIAQELGRIGQQPQATSAHVLTLKAAAALEARDEETLNAIFATLRINTGVDFSHYKPPTLKRRIARRMILRKTMTLSEYAIYLQETPQEVEELFKDMLIYVTEFFRDREMFEHLKKQVFPALVQAHKKGEPVRIWSAGCSTGEEAYSLAIAFVEYMEKAKKRIPFLVFGSDLSEASIQKARAGVYPASIAAQVSAARLKRFFTKLDGHYQIAKEIREMCVFAKQNLISDPPFSQIDLISCRNVFIYLEPTAQKHLLPIFHYALNPTGFLVLGKSESIGAYTDLFLAKYKTQKIYMKKASLAKLRLDIALPSEASKNVDRKIEKLEREVAMMKEQLLATLKMSRGSFGKSQARSEGVALFTEELQSTNEELETAKEELQSTNEELVTVNEELQARNGELDQTNSYAQGILGTMREPLLVLDKHLRVKSANDAFYAMFSVTPAEVEHTLIYELKNRRWDTPQLRETLEKILPQKSSFKDLEITFDFPDSGSKVMLFNGRRLIQSEVGEELILLAMQDITEQRLLQERNDSFMSMASHELKTPVTTIKTLVQILQQRFGDTSDKTLVEYLARMDQQVDQLTKLVIDLLDVSKIKADKFELEETTFEFDPLAHELVKSCQFLSLQHTISIKGSTGAQVTGDRNAIGRVFTNLIVNAIKYSPKAHTILVTLSHTSKEVRVGIQDFGIGIAKLHRDKIFQRFFQVDNESGQNFSGLGIGLYISEAIVKQHNGRIWVESEDGTGSTFFFTIPVTKRTNTKEV